MGNTLPCCAQHHCGPGAQDWVTELRGGRAKWWLSAAAAADLGGRRQWRRSAYAGINKLMVRQTKSCCGAMNIYSTAAILLCCPRRSNKGRERPSHLSWFVMSLCTSRRATACSQACSPRPRIKATWPHGCLQPTGTVACDPLPRVPDFVEREEAPVEQLIIDDPSWALLLAQCLPPGEQP